MSKLDTYNSKRNFDKTQEPIGKINKKSTKKLKYVIHHHLARKNHYDLRLEYNGIYISFAIPKGPSFNPQDKRLAIMVEDHPLSYGNFEGTIPEGEYGGGTIMLWDVGYWKPDKNTKVNFNKGPIKFSLNGKRLKGKWSLIKFKENNWLLIKENDKHINKGNISKYKTSIKTGRTMKEIKENKLTTTKINIKNIKITNPQKIIFEQEKITKEEIMKYYTLVAKRMMPFLDNRLISTVRCPNGLKSETFFMKHLNNESNDLKKKIIKDKTNNYKDYYYINNINGIFSEVQMNSYEFHIWGSKQNKINHPDILVFDLDPDESLSIKKIKTGVRDLKSILDHLNLKSFLKTSGGKGYHIYIPLKSTSWKKTEQIAKDIANLMVANWPNKYTTNIKK